MSKILEGMSTYLKDWKKLLAHALIGVLLLAIALFTPLSPMIKAGFMVAVIWFYILRMRPGKKQRQPHACSGCDGHKH